MAKNKYLNGILPMTLINFSIGSVYCWTLFKEDILAYTGFSRAVTEWSFSLAIFFLGMSAAFGGKLVEKNPRRSAFLTFIFFTVGWILTGLGIQIRSAALTIIAFGVIQGIGLGLGYITPVKTMMIWLGNRKGFAAGLSIAAFGLAGVVANPIVLGLLGRMPVYQVFYVLAAIYGVGLFIASRLLWRPPVSQADLAAEAAVSDPNFSARSVVFTPKFILLWVVFFLNIVGGLALISHEKQIYFEIGHITTGTLGMFVMITATANLLGRLTMASAQDKMALKHLPYFLMSLASIAAMILAVSSPYALNITLITIIIIQFMFGVGFSCMPNILHQNWGISHLSTVHGLILTAWAAAGLVGNQLASWFMAGPGQRALYLTLGGIYIAQFLALLAWTRVRQRAVDAADSAEPRAIVNPEPEEVLVA